MPACITPTKIVSYGRNLSMHNEKREKNLLQNREGGQKNGYLSDRTKAKIKNYVAALAFIKSHNLPHPKTGANSNETKSTVAKPASGVENVSGNFRTTMTTVK